MPLSCSEFGDPFRSLGRDVIFVEANVDRVWTRDRRFDGDEQDALIVRRLHARAKAGRRGRNRQDDVAALAYEIVELRQLHVDVVVRIGEDEVAGGEALLLVVLDQRLVLVERGLAPGIPLIGIVVAELPRRLRRCPVGVGVGTQRRQQPIADVIRPQGLGQQLEGLLLLRGRRRELHAVEADDRRLLRTGARVRQERCDERRTGE